MSKLSNISGFPEWLPEEKLIEERIIDLIRNIYKSFGFTPIETPSVELKSTLSSKGVIDKEIYLLRRALKDSDEKDDEELALHFDLTVPFARYVAQHLSKLQFPFKRYQLQKVWRGERPQRGRFREFYQFDIDIVTRETLPLACDSEIISAIHAVFTALNIGKFCIRVNNRKVLLGLYSSLGLSSEVQKQVISIVDKLDKIGIDGIKKELTSLNLKSHQIDQIITWTELRTDFQNVSSELSKIAVDNDLFKEGVEELSLLLKLIPEDSIQFDLSLARGLDYYTGAIFEVILMEHPEYGTVSSGGRYDDLVNQFINQKVPGVGASIGITRIIDLILKKNLILIESASPSKVLVTVLNEPERPALVKLADKLRKLGIFCEVFPTAPKLGKQIEYADKKGIPYCLFAENDKIRIKDLRTKQETDYSTIEEWIQTLN